MNALKNPSLFLPMSRPSSPAHLPPSRPDSSVGLERSKALNKLSFATFRRPSPSPALSAPLLVHDGSYLEMLSLKLSEAVSRALQQPIGTSPAHELIAGKRPLPAGRGQGLGALISSEINATSDNPHLRRAVLRSLHRPLSVLVSNLNGALVPLLSNPAFLSLPTVQSPNCTAVQLHTLALAAFAGELLETFDELGLGLDSDLNGLRAIRDGLSSIITRVVNPLVAGLRNDMEHHIESLITPMAACPGGKGSSPLHPSIITLTALVPIYSRALARYTQWSQKTLTTCLISFAWKGLFALSHRPYSPPSLPNSPASSFFLKKRRGSPTMSPPTTPSPSRFTIKLPPSRPTTPPPPPQKSLASADARALYGLLSTLPRPTSTSKQGSLASEAVTEAMKDLVAMPALLEALEYAGRDVNRLGHAQLIHLTDELPTLICLPLLLSVFGDGHGLHVADLLGLSEAEYVKGCMSGFSRAEECAALVGNRVLEALRLLPQHEGVQAIISWLEDELSPEM